MTRNEAMERAAQGFADVGRWILRTPIRWRLALLDQRDARAVRAETARVPTLRERQEDLILFYDRYETLVETLCDAAQYGPDARHEARYQELRTWMQAAYPALRKFVSAYLRYDPCDAARSLDLHGTGSDAFEALFAASTLEDFLRSDDGKMIERIDRTREALGKYADHLRQLIAQERGA